MQTGFFGIPGTYEVTKTHLVKRGKPWCGVLLRKEMRFQFNANGVDLDYLECKLCEAKHERAVHGKESKYEKVNESDS